MTVCEVREQLIRRILLVLAIPAGLAVGIAWFDREPSAGIVDTVRVQRGTVTVDLSLDGKLVNGRQIIIIALREGACRVRIGDGRTG